MENVGTLVETEEQNNQNRMDKSEDKPNWKSYCANDLSNPVSTELRDKAV